MIQSETSKKPKVIVILSSWSSCSTAMTGFFDRCGGHSCPPHFQTNDQRTPTAYENKDYVDALHKFIDTDSKESLFTQRGDIKKFCSWTMVYLTGNNFQKYRKAVFNSKTPSSDFCSRPDWAILWTKVYRLDPQPWKNRTDPGSKNWSRYLAKKEHRFFTWNQYILWKQKLFPIEYEQFLTNEKIRKELLAFCELEILGKTKSWWELA